MYNKPVCRGSWVLGTACGRCERCEDARPGKPLPVAPNPQEGGTHTPGPWSFDYGTVPPDGPGTYADIYVDGGDTIIAHFNNQIVEGRATARLIAASPTMYDFISRRAAEGDAEARKIMEAIDASR